MISLYYHPLASYCWKALIALYERNVPFEKHLVDLGNAADRAELAALWPLCKFPVLRHDDRTIVESSIIMEYVDCHLDRPQVRSSRQSRSSETDEWPPVAVFGPRGGTAQDGSGGLQGESDLAEPRLFPRDAESALRVRLWDRIFDNYVHTPMQEIVLAHLLGGTQDLTRASNTISIAYELTNQQLQSSTWIGGDDFTAADCSAAPALFYAMTIQSFPSHFAPLHAYFERLMGRASVLRTLEEAKPYFSNYPLNSAIPARFR